MEITDRKNRKGIKGFIMSGAESSKGELPFITDPKTKHPLWEYDEVIVGGPIWAGAWCTVILSFLNTYGNQLPEKVSYVFTHMSPKAYEECVEEADACLSQPHERLLSLYTKKNNVMEIEQFIHDLKSEESR